MDFSIITVVKNGAKTIDHCLLAVSTLISSSINIKIEHIIIDGNSTDNTISICKNYKVQIHDQVGVGIYAAMNQGVAVARGRYILFSNADDCIRPIELLDAMGLIMSSPKSAVYLFGIRLINNQDSVGVWMPKNTVSNKYFMPYPHPGFIAHKCVLRVNKFNTFYKLSADYNQALQILSKFDPVVHDIVIADFQVGGVSSNYRAVYENMVIRYSHRVGFINQIVAVIYDFYRIILPLFLRKFFRIVSLFERGNDAAP